MKIDTVKIRKNIKLTGESDCPSCGKGKIKPFNSKYFLKCDFCGLTIHGCPSLKNNG